MLQYKPKYRKYKPALTSSDVPLAVCPSDPYKGDIHGVQGCTSVDILMSISALDYIEMWLKKLVVCIDNEALITDFVAALINKSP